MLSNSEKENCSQLIQSCFNFHNRNGRLLSTPFEELPAPSKTAYYEKVSNPIALKTVLDRLNQGAYNHLKDFYSDLKLVFYNYAQSVNRSGRDWQDASRMDQYVDEMWEQKAIKNLLPPLEELFPGSSHPRLDSRKLNPNEPSVGNASRKRSRSQSTISTGSVEEVPTPVSNLSNQITRTQNKRGRKSTALNQTGEDEVPQNPTSGKDRPHDTDPGWMRDNNSNMNLTALGTFILTRLKNERLPILDSASYSVLDPLQGALSDTTIAQDSPALNLDVIELRLNRNLYMSISLLDQDLHKAFTDAEKAYSQNPERLGGIYVLKRLYQELTQGDGTIALRDSIPVGGAKRLSTVTMGPGNPTQLPKNDEALKLRAKDKTLLEGVRHKGDHFRIGDWVHLFNPDHPCKPIVAQIFNTYRRVDTGRKMVSVCWYYRPEETVHYISRTFIVDEVFKTGNFIEHVVEDILGRCLVLFYTKYLRGRPTPPLWAPGMPTYICEHRYKDDVYSFKKIKNWESCVPSNTRNESTDSNFHFFPHAQLVSSLIRVPSPFLSAPTNQFKGSGQPLVASPQEVRKEIPKDQMKCHDLNLTLDQISKILGRLPTSPPRRPHRITDPAGEESTGQQSPSLTSSLLNPTQFDSTSSSIGNPSSSNSYHHSSLIGYSTPTSIGHPSTLPASNPANLLSALSSYSHPQSPNSVLLNIDPLLKSLSTNRKLCLVDLLAGLDQFEKLPTKILDTLLETSEPPTESRSDSPAIEKSNPEHESINASELDIGKTNKEKEDKSREMMWFPCLPSPNSIGSRSRSWSGSTQDEHHSTKKNRNRNRTDSVKPTTANLDKLKHSQVYLDWLNQSKKT